jgi:hydrogenase maturation protease
MNTLFLGYGNPDRQDDGVAWHVLRGVALELGLIPPETWEDEFPSASGLAFRFELQLTPEMAEDIRAFDRVCFVDAHTGRIPVEMQLTTLEPGFQTSPFTHHLTPEMLLNMCQSLYGAAPEGVLLSIRGYSFGFETELSEQTAGLLPEAIKRAVDWQRG